MAFYQRGFRTMLSRFDFNSQILWSVLALLENSGSELAIAPISNFSQQRVFLRVCIYCCNDSYPGNSIRNRERINVSNETSLGQRVLHSSVTPTLGIAGNQITNIVNLAVPQKFSFSSEQGIGPPLSLITAESGRENKLIAKLF
jgi:hypothetical protein